MAAAVGWNAALPRFPATRITPSISGLAAQPANPRQATATNGPATARTRGRQRSASGPKTSWATEPDSWMDMASAPAPASDRPSFGMKSGSSGA